MLDWAEKYKRGSGSQPSVTIVKAELFMPFMHAVTAWIVKATYIYIMSGRIFGSAGEIDTFLPWGPHF